MNMNRRTRQHGTSDPAESSDPPQPRSDVFFLCFLCHVSVSPPPLGAVDCGTAARYGKSSLYAGRTMPHDMVGVLLPLRRWTSTGCNGQEVRLVVTNKMPWIARSWVCVALCREHRVRIVRR